MAEVKLQIPFDEIHGAIEKHGIKKCMDAKFMPRKDKATYISLCRGHRMSCHPSG